jgi:hypothetical protein
MKFRVTVNPQDANIDLTGFSGLEYMLNPEEEDPDIDLADIKSIEDHIKRKEEEFSELCEEIYSNIRDLSLETEEEIFLYYGRSGKRKLYYKILSRIIEASFNEEEYRGSESLSDEDQDKSFSESSTESSSSSSSSEDSCYEEEEEDYSSAPPLQSLARPNVIPRPVGTPQPKVSSAYMDQLSLRRIRTVTSSAAPVTRTNEIKTNFVDPERPIIFRGIEPIKLRPGIQMTSSLYKGVQITIFKNI